MILFLDASALVKRYFREAESDVVERLLRIAPVAVSRLSEIEVVSALARRQREQILSLQQRDAGITRFLDDLSTWIVVELSPQVVTTARGLLLRHSLRAADATQLACCLVFQGRVQQPVGFVSYDEKLKRAAESEGLSDV